MSEFQSKKRDKRTFSLTTLLVLVILAGLVSYWMISAFAIRWDPVEYIPEDSVAAVIIDVTGSGDKKAALDTIDKALKEAGVDDPGQALVDRLRSAFGISIDREAIHHLNGRGAVVVIPEMSGANPGAAIVIGARGNKGAEALQEAIGSSLSQNWSKISNQSYKDFDYRVVPNRKFNTYIGVVDGGVVYATTEFAFKKIVDTIKGGKCLRDNPEFKRLGNADESTVATLFFSGVQCEKTIGPMMALGAGSMMVPGLSSLPDVMKNNVAILGTLNAKPDCISMHIKGITRNSAPAHQEIALDKLVANTPEDAAVAFVVSDWNKVWAAIKEQVMSDVPMKKQIDQVMAQAKTFLFMDPFADGLDRITMLGGYYVPGESVERSFPGHFTLTAQVDKPEVVQTTVEKVHFAMAMMGGTVFSELPVAGETVYLGPDKGPVRYSDALVGDKFLLIMSGKKPGAAVSSAVRTAAGKKPGLAESAKFKQMKRYLPAKARAVLYCDLGAVTPLAGAKVQAQDRAVVKRFGRFAFTSSASGKEYEVHGVLPLVK